MSDKRKIYDYIKRTINPYGRPFEGTTYELGLKIMDFIENIDGEKENGWIPVSEKLPEFKKIDVLGSPDIYKTEKVFVQTKRGEMFVAWCHKTVYISKIFSDEYLWYTHGTGGRKMRVMSKVIAWMPLPEPYKEDEP